MFLALKADKDTYVTNKFVNGKQTVSGNVGIAGTLDLFKLYGITVFEEIPQTELSRLLIHFDLNLLKNIFDSGKIDINDSSFKCFISLKDVYGGQATPSNFTVNVFPLSASFFEGIGKDTAYYSDEDKCNFISASHDAAWGLVGCDKACFSTGSGDYITSSLTITDTLTTQLFKIGDEDLFVDVTPIISATLKNDLPDEGFRISFNSSIEADERTYFVKRFASRHAFDETKHPKLIVKFDDSIQDESGCLYLDAPEVSKLFLYNYFQGQLMNLVSSSSEVTGSNCILLELQTEVSGTGTYSLFFTGSQKSIGLTSVEGMYFADVEIPLTDPQIKISHQLSGSVKFKPIWSSLDKTVSFFTGSSIVAKPPERRISRLNPRKYSVYARNMSSEYSQNEDVTIRVDIFDENDPTIIAKRLPFQIPGLVLKNSYYGIRDSVTNSYIIPIDTLHKSTKLSSDSNGMYFTFSTSALIPNRTYLVDLSLTVDGQQQLYLGASSVFKILKF